METLKIGLATDWFLPRLGGVEIHVHELAMQLTERGHEVHVITSSAYGNGIDVPYHIHHVPAEKNVFFFNWTGIKAMRAIHRINKWEMFDIVHGHSFFAPISLAAANDASALLGIPSILTTHSIPELHRLKFMNAALLRKVMQKITSFIAVSSVVEKHLADILDWTRWGRPIWVIPNGIDVEFWRSVRREKAREELGIDGPLVLTVSRLAVKKRVSAVPKIAKEVVKEIPDVQFIIIGDGVERRAIEMLIRQYGLENNVHLLGKMPREDVRKYMGAADVYLNPTKKEALGIALLEAQAAGVPGIGYAGSGVVDIIEHGKNGFLYWNDKEAVKCVVELLEDEKKRKRMGKNARRRAERFDWKYVVKEIEDAYKKTIDIYEYVPFRAYDLYKRWFKRSPLPLTLSRTAHPSLPPREA